MYSHGGNMNPGRRAVIACVLVAFVFSIVAPALGQEGTTPQPLTRSEFFVTPPREAPEKKHYLGPTDEIRTIDEPRGVLSPKGKVTIEPSLKYTLSTSNQVSIIGYSILPALVIGLIDVRSVDSYSFPGAIPLRYGLTDRVELEYKVPYLYRDDTTGSRDIGGSNKEVVFNPPGPGLGDMEFSIRYQLNKPGGPGPFYVGGIRVKARNGKDPFEVPIDNTTGLPDEREDLDEHRLRPERDRQQQTGRAEAVQFQDHPCGESDLRDFLQAGRKHEPRHIARGGSHGGGSGPGCVE